MDLFLIVALLGSVVVWLVFGFATIDGIWKDVFGRAQPSLFEKVFVVVNWPIIVCAYAIGKSFGLFFGKKK